MWWKVNYIRVIQGNLESGYTREGRGGRDIGERAELVASSQQNWQRITPVGGKDLLKAITRLILAAWVARKSEKFEVYLYGV